MATKKKRPARLKKGTAKKVSDKVLAINLAGIEGRKSRRIRIPEGMYLAKVHEATFETAKSSGNEMIRWIFEVVGGKYDGTWFYYNTVTSVAESLWNLRAVLEALGIKVKDSTMNIPLGRLANRTCGIEVVDGEYEGTTRSEINDIFPEALLEEEEDEEDEDEYEDDDLDEDEDDDLDDEEDDEEEDDDPDDEDEDEDDEEEEDWEVDLDDEEL